MADIGSLDTNGIELAEPFAGSMIMGFKNYELLDGSSGDATATKKNCRCIWADTSGIAKIDYTGTDGTTVTEVVTLLAGVNDFHNVTKLYQYYTGTTAGTAKCYNSSGTEKTNAIKLRW